MLIEVRRLSFYIPYGSVFVSQMTNALKLCTLLYEFKKCIVPNGILNGFILIGRIFGSQMRANGVNCTTQCLQLNECLIRVFKVNFIFLEFSSWTHYSHSLYIQNTVGIGHKCAIWDAPLWDTPTKFRVKLFR